jgi:hypothetical protein
MKKFLLVLTCLAALSVLPACTHFGCDKDSSSAASK